LILGWFPPDGMPQTHTKTLTHIHRSTHPHTHILGRSNPIKKTAQHASVHTQPWAVRHEQ
jgi:hypothetical protein